MHVFRPTAAEPHAFREVLGRFATGVTVVTIATPDGPLGLTANSFSSLSLDPPMVLWAPDKNSSRYQPFVEAEHFAIHILAADQLDLARRFARDGRPTQGLDWATGDTGVPVFTPCLARFECRRAQVFDGGDHSIITGEVLGAALRNDDPDTAAVNAAGPLVFAMGRYGGFDPQD
ncbi:MAG: flavin reductase family protein [Celeribacter sp.]|jgi:flavin reductase (DIM6/NTAB) family NADH-FMN oxidoreductase RutF